MNARHFFHLPRNSFVASSVTLLVSGWFLVASGAILADPASPYTHRAPDVRLEPMLIEASRADVLKPDVRLASITVEGHRADARPVARLAMIRVNARRADAHTL